MIQKKKKKIQFHQMQFLRFVFFFLPFSLVSSSSSRALHFRPRVRDGFETFMWLGLFGFLEFHVWLPLIPQPESF